MKLARREDLTAELLRDTLSYDPCTGAFFWRKPGHGRQMGIQIGSNRETPYIVITIGTLPFLAHRLAWLYVHGVWPPETIDHINGNPSDNRLANLRACTYQENSRNQSATSRSKSGVRGVSKKYRRWQVQITHAGKEHYVGSYLTLEEAAEAYNKAARSLHGEFAREARV